MAEFQRMPTQEELQKILYMGQMQGKTTQEIINENLNKGGTVKPLPENFFTTASAGAKRAGDYINRAGTAADVAKLFPGYQPETKVTIPTSFNVVPKVDPYSGQIGNTGINTQQIPIGNVLQQIKPADVLGVSGAERAYGDIGAGKAPQPMDVVDTLGLGAAGMAAGKGLLGVAKATKGMPVGMSIQDVTNAGLLSTAPKSDIGFYSAVENAAMASPRKSATGQAFLNDIMKGQDVRADEIKWMGLDDYLKDKKNITKQEVQDYIANNRVDVKEVQLGGSIPLTSSEKARLSSLREKDQIEGLGGSEADEYNDLLNKEIRYEEAPETKFGQYTLPGGENYREILLTMPSKNPEFDPSNLSRLTELSNKNRTEAENIEYKSLAKQYDASLRGETAEQYRSSHFDQPNILAHLRVNDRVDADGKKMLLIEEVQSDWHQAGRDKGYAKNVKDEIAAIQKQMDELGDQRDPITNQLVNEKQWLELGKQKDELVKQSKGVPDAPFKDTWYQLALKRAIQHAAENGYDRIGLTTGSQQAARFDLSKQVDRVISSKENGGFRIFARDINGKNHDMGVFNENNLSEAVGKDLAKKISSQTKNTETFEGVDLSVGGEGMKKYYDEIYPKFLDKYGKKWGAKVGETKVNTVMKANPGSMIPKMDQEPVRYIDITPEMKAGVSKGQPLFMAAPIGVTGGLLGTEQDQRR